MADGLPIAIALCALSVLLVKSGFFHWLYKRLRCIYYLRKLPVILRPNWLTGHTYQAHPERVVEVLKAAHENPANSTYTAGICRMDMASFVHLATVDAPDTVAAILRSSEPKNPYIYSFLEPWLGQGLLISNGKKWARNRRLLTPAFHFDVLKGYASVYYSAVGILLEKWRSALQDSDDGASGGVRVNVSHDIPLLTMDVILRCAMSYQSECQTQTSNYGNAMHTLLEESQLRGLNVLHHLDTIYYRTKRGQDFAKACDTAHQYADEIIEERRRMLAEDSAGDERSKDFLDILLTAKDTDGKGLSHRDVRNEVDTFLFEGHDTTASALQWTLYFLAGHPEAQERCRQEARTVLVPSGQLHPEVSCESLQRMDYTGQCLKETMRLATTVPLIYRYMTRDARVGGYLVPEGAWVIVNLYSLHHHLGYWPDPWKYDPSRFDPGKNDSRASFSFAPFSGGPRNCIGQNLAMEEMKAAVGLILLEFSLSVPDDMQDVKQWTYATNRPSKAIHLLAEPLAT